MAVLSSTLQHFTFVSYFDQLCKCCCFFYSIEFPFFAVAVTHLLISLLNCGRVVWLASGFSFFSAHFAHAMLETSAWCDCEIHCLDFAFVRLSDNVWLWLSHLFVYFGFSSHALFASRFNIFALLSAFTPQFSVVSL